LVTGQTGHPDRSPDPVEAWPIRLVAVNRDSGADVAV
jgi:hypothetical protein